MPRPRRSLRAWTYARSGVSRAGIGAAVRVLLRETNARIPAGHGTPLRAPGHYAGLLRIGPETLALTTDTVGTKVLLAAELDRWEEVGQDLVAVNANDLAAVGARPAALVDTILCPRPSAQILRGIGRGLRRALAEAEMHLVGGETAVVPEIVSSFDLGGTALGFFPRGRAPILGRRIRAGDWIVGLPSSGLHANGFTLVRRLLRQRRIRLEGRRPGAERPIADELLAPSRIYARVADRIASLPGVVGLAHMSGGGVRNLVRLSPRHRFLLDRWPAPPPLFRWIQSLGRISDREMFQTFNQGIGFVVVVRPSALEPLEAALSREGFLHAPVIGRIAPGMGVELPTYRLRFARYY